MCDNNITDSIKELKEKFYEIKKIPFHKSLRKGSTGIGYTFETLIGKKEDSSSEPDYKGIEIKTKLGYSKSPITLFNLVGKKDDETTIYKYLIDNYGYFNNSEKKQKRLSCDVYSNTFTRIKSGFLLKLKVDLNNNIIKLLIIDNNFNKVDNSIYWNINDIYERLFTKLRYMAIIKGYPYNYQGDLYYKYTNINIYKLKDFDKFLKLLLNGNIYITINVSYNIEDNGINIKGRNIIFRINLNSIDYLFKKIY